MGKPGPKPKPDSLTDAPVMAVKIPPKLLQSLSEEAAAFGMSRPEWVRAGLEWWNSLTPAQKARMCGRPAPKAQRCLRFDDDGRKS